MKVSPPDDGNSEKFWNEVWSRLSTILQPSYCHKDFSSKNYAIFIRTSHVFGIAKIRNKLGTGTHILKRLEYLEEDSIKEVLLVALS